MKKRMGCIWIGAGVVLALLAGVLAFMAIMRASSTQLAVPQQETAKIKVVVATRAMAVRDLIREGDVELRAADPAMVPESAIRNLEEAIGWLTTTPLSADEMVLSTHIISPTVKGGAVAYTMEKGKVAMAFPADDLMTSNRLLQAGDHVDVLFSIDVKVPGEQQGSLVTFNALQNLEIAALVSPSSLDATAKSEMGLKGAQPTAIVFALDPQDALVLKYLRDVGGTVDIVLRAPEAKERYEVQPVHENYMADRYQLQIPEQP